MQLTEELLKNITERLIAEFQPEQIILFGSYAWGKPTEESDIDLAVIVAENKLAPALRSYKAHKCLRGINISKDILVKTRKEFDTYKEVHASLEAQIHEQGKVLYDRTKK